MPRTRWTLRISWQVAACIAASWSAEASLPPKTNEGIDCPGWIIGRSDPSPDHVVDAWLTVPTRPAARWSVAIRDRKDLRLWRIPEGSDCGEEAQGSDAEFAMTESAHFCFSVHRVGSTRLVATVRHVPTTASIVECASVVASETITVKREEIAAWHVALLSALLGLVGGALSTVIAKKLEARGARLEEKARAKAAILGFLLPELTKNRDILSRCIATGTPRTDEPLQRTFFDKLTGDRGALAFLTAKERSQFFDTIQQLYLGLDQFNRQVRQDPESDASKALAAGLLEEFVEILGGNDAPTGTS